MEKRILQKKKMHLVGYGYKDLTYNLEFAEDCKYEIVP